MHERYREEVLNVVLAQRLACTGLSATPESILKDLRKGRMALPDVLIQYRGMRLAIEAKYSDSPNAEKVVSGQARERIDSGISQISLAIVYPSEFRNIALQQLDSAIDRGELRFSVYSESEVGRERWHSGGINDIVNEIRRVHEVMCTEDIVQHAAESIRGCLDGLAKILENKPGICEELSVVLGIGRPIKEDDDTRRRRIHTITRVAALVLENAFIFQEQLAASGVEKVQSLRQNIRHADFSNRAIKHWDWISKHINYVPIFKLASEILSRVPASGASDGAVRVLAEKALEVSSNQAALRHDLMGRIYHYLLHEAKYLGTYYTSVSAATLLAKMALNPDLWPKRDFSDEKGYRDLRIVDLTCGTGTLLMAATQALADNFIIGRAKNRKSMTEKRLGALHGVVMEKVMHGFDVLPSAIHLTASTLSLLSPDVLFRELHLYSLPLTVKGETALLGSLEFIEQARIETQFTLFENEEANTEARQFLGKGYDGAVAELPMTDLFIMNPPFTRSVGDNLLFGNLPEAKRAVMQKALKYRVAKAELASSITAGLGSVYVAIADKYLKPDGRLAFVLPAALASGIAWESTRNLLKRKYHLEYVVVCHEADRWNFSENTDLSELLFIARKLRDGEENDQLHTSFVNLWRNPLNSGDALAISRLIKSVPPGKVLDKNAGIGNLTELGRKYGEVISTPMKVIAETWWPTAFAQTELTLTAWSLRSGTFKLPGIKKSWTIPVIELGAIADLGPDRRDIHDGFDVVDEPTPYRAFWNHDAGKTLCMAQKANKYLSPRTKPAPGRQQIRDSELLWPKAGALLFAERLRLNSQRLTAVCLPHPVLTNTWWPIRLMAPDKRKDRALAMWQNSSFGLSIVGLSRVSTEGSWVQFKKPSILAMPVLNVEALSPSQLNTFDEIFKKLGQLQFRPMSQLTDDDVRTALDLSIASVLGLPDPTALREMIAREPVFTNKPLIPIESTKTETIAPQFELSFV